MPGRRLALRAPAGRGVRCRRSSRRERGMTTEVDDGHGPEDRLFLGPLAPSETGVGWDGPAKGVPTPKSTADASGDGTPDQRCAIVSFGAVRSSLVLDRRPGRSPAPVRVEALRLH